MMRRSRRFTLVGILLALFLLLGTALTQNQEEEYREVVIVYPDYTDVFSLDADFWFSDMKDWAKPDLLKELTSVFSTGNVGQPEFDCDYWMAELQDRLDSAEGIFSRAKAFLNSSPEPALFYADGSQANKKAAGYTISRFGSINMLMAGEIFARLAAQGCL